MGADGSNDMAARQVGALLQRLRTLSGQTQEQLAERSGYSANYISKLERGQRLAPSDALDRLSDSLDLSAEERAALHTAMTAARQADTDGGALVGRDVELGMLRQAVADVGPPALFFTGESGIGKTRLLDEVARLAERSHWRVVRGGVQRARVQEPYAPLTSALAASIERLAPAERAHALRAAPWLDLLLPELRGRRAHTPRRARADTAAATNSTNGRRSSELPPEQQRRLLFAAVAHYLEAIADKSGTLLLLDDLQWATEDGLDLLAALFTDPGGTARRRSIRLIGAYRDMDSIAGTPLGAFLGDLAHGALAHVRPLMPLTTAESERLLTRLGAARATEIARRAGGVPFFLISFAEDLARRAATRSSESEQMEPVEIPWTVVQVIRQRVATLTRPAQELLSITAAVGRSAPRALLAKLSSLPDEEVARALEGAITARLLDEASNRGYTFTHDLIRETVEGDISVGRRAALHRQIGDALERDPQAPAEALAFHFTASDDPTRAAPYLTLAGDEAAARVAHAAAASLYQQALDVLPPVERARGAAPVEEKLGMALARLGRFGAAVAMLEQSRARFEAAGDLESVHRVTARLMDTRYIENLSHAGGVASGESWRAPLRAMFATGRVMRRQGRASGDGAVQQMGALAEGVALLALDHLRAGAATLEAALPVDPTPGERHHIADVSVLLASALLGMGAWERCERLCARMALMAEPMADPHLLATFNTCQGAALHARGDRLGAQALFARADALYDQAPPSTYSVNLLYIRAPSLIEDDSDGEHGIVSGQETRARDYLETALQSARAMGAPHAERAALTHLAELDLLSGEPQRAVSRLEPLAESDLRWISACRLRATLAAARLALGDPARALPLATAAVATARYTGAWVQGLTALRICGMVEGALGHREQAQHLLAEGLQRAQAMPYPYAEAQLRAAVCALDVS